MTRGEAVGCSTRGPRGAGAVSPRRPRPRPCGHPRHRRAPPRRSRRRCGGRRCRSASRSPGCHCTPTAKPGTGPAAVASTCTASIVPSGAMPSTRTPGASLFTPWLCSEFTAISLAPGQPVQPAARGHPDGVRLADSHLARGDHRRGVVDPVRQVLQPLVQRAAQRHVQFLEAAADRQHRHAARHRGADQRQGGAVARHVLPGALGVRRAVIVAGMHVGAAAGEHDPVQPLEQGLDIRGRPVGRDQHRHGVHEMVGRLDIGIGGGVVRHAENTELFGAATYADERPDDPGRLHRGE